MLCLPWSVPGDEGNSGVFLSFFFPYTSLYDVVKYRIAEIKKPYWSAPPH